MPMQIRFMVLTKRGPKTAGVSTPTSALLTDAMVLDEGKAKTIVLRDSSFRGPETHHSIAGGFDTAKRAINRTALIGSVMNEDQTAWANQLRGELKFSPHMFFGMHRVQ
jgi:hypothetical protein